jgi:WD40 repeat protein
VRCEYRSDHGVFIILGFLAGYFLLMPADITVQPSEPVPSAEPIEIAGLGLWREVQVIDGGCGDIFAVDWSRDGSQLVGGCDDGSVRIWDAYTGDLQLTLTGHTSQVWSVDWSPDWSLTARIASGSEDSTIRVWDANSGALVVEIEPGGKWVSAVEWSLDWRGWYRTWRRRGRIWDAHSGELLSELRARIHRRTT